MTNRPGGANQERLIAGAPGASASSPDIFPTAACGAVQLEEIGKSGPHKF